MMSGFKNAYDTITYHDRDLQTLAFNFSIHGRKDIIKVINYTYVDEYNGLSIFNLGLGDFNIKTGILSEVSLLNNNDHYKILHTVLNTIPQFFQIYNGAILMIEGSDSGPDFAADCKLTCIRNCNEVRCKKENRRMKIYRGFVNKNFELLNLDYSFKGVQVFNGQYFAENYVVGTNYKTVWVTKNV